MSSLKLLQMQGRRLRELLLKLLKTLQLKTAAEVAGYAAAARLQAERVAAEVARDAAAARLQAEKVAAEVARDAAVYCSHKTAG